MANLGYNKTAGYDLHGMTFGKLKVVGEAGYEGRHRMWMVKCECGCRRRIKTGKLTNIQNPMTHCGCERKAHDKPEWRKQMIY